MGIFFPMRHLARFIRGISLSVDLNRSAFQDFVRNAVMFGHSHPRFHFYAVFCRRGYRRRLIFFISSRSRLFSASAFIRIGIRKIRSKNSLRICIVRMEHIVCLRILRGPAVIIPDPDEHGFNRGIRFVQKRVCPFLYFCPGIGFRLQEQPQRDLSAGIIISGECGDRGQVPLSAGTHFICAGIGVVQETVSGASAPGRADCVRASDGKFPDRSMACPGKSGAAHRHACHQVAV